jgi:DNA recombination protein RmuC
MLLPGARKLADLGARGSRELGAPATVDAAARDVVKRN